MLVENACEKPLFASPEAVAAAVAYVDARFSLLAASAALAERDPGYRPAFERLRRGLEADRYGLVAHVLMTRGCNGADCAELRLLRDPARVVANMKARAFEAALGVHALAWPPNGSKRGRCGIVPPSYAAAAADDHGRGGSSGRIGRTASLGLGQVRFPVGQFDSGGQHHERGARRAAGARAAVRRTAAEASGRGGAPQQRRQLRRPRHRQRRAGSGSAFRAAAVAADRPTQTVPPARPDQHPPTR